jgi:hypothetical protein
MTLPMLSDFAIRLAGGLAAMLAIAPWREVPIGFFRTHCQVILGLGVLATLAATRPPFEPVVFGLVLTLAILSFGATLAWGLGLPRLGVPAAWAIAATATVVLSPTAQGGSWDRWALNAASRLASASLLGSTLTAMLLGHYYLTAPAMSIEPLKRFVRWMAASLVVRTILACMALFLIPSSSTGGATIGPLFVAMRWGMGIAGFGLATYLAWRTVQIRSTQSATGILYIAMTLLLFGELSSLILARDSHVLI